jgi:purine-nucleoside phosphorylase
VPEYLRPSGPIASRAVLTGDPGRAMMLAQELTEEPKMTNHARGLWGYTGRAPDGEPLTVQSTGIGAPSAAAVLRDLAELGLERAVRVGTCVARTPEQPLGRLLVVSEAYAADGVSRSLGHEGPGLRPSISGALASGSDAELAQVASYDSEPGETTAPAYDLQTAALIAVGEELGLELGAVLVVARNSDGVFIRPEDLDAAAKRAGRLAAAALSS